MDSKYFSPFLFKTKKINMKTLKLFNAVLASETTSKNLFLDETINYGFILQPEVAGRKDVKQIISYLTSNVLNGEQLNKTFHKSWGKIESSTDSQLLAEQLLHYFTTYGFKSLGLYSDDLVYIPNDILEVPSLKSGLPLKVIKGLSKQELIDKCLDMLSSGMALKEETVNDILEILNDLNYEFTSETLDNVKNKEAKIKLGLKYNILPTNNTEFVRMLVYLATNQTLIINDRNTLMVIAVSGVRIDKLCTNYGLEKLSESFLRYKKIFLAFKKASTKNRKVVNRLRKLAIKNHKALPEDYLNTITYRPVVDFDRLETELNKVNNFRKIRLLNALSLRMQDTDARVYRIRNGKTWVAKKSDSTKANYDVIFNLIYSNLISSLNLEGKRVKLDNKMTYVLPSTEKTFVGNIPTGSFVDFDDNAIFGIYWEDGWGANDLDLSAIALTKVGWNTKHKGNSNNLLFSGDITSAYNGATEAFYVKNSLTEPSLIVNNIYSGVNGCKFKIFAAHEKATSFNSNYTVDPNNKIFEIDSVMTQRQKTIGLVIPQEKGVRFVLTDYASGSKGISSTGKDVEMTKEYLFNENLERLTLNDVLKDAGCIFVDENPDIDLSLDNLEKDSILSLLK